MALDFVEQGAVTDVEVLGGAASIPAGGRESVLQHANLRLILDPVDDVPHSCRDGWFLLDHGLYSRNSDGWGCCCCAGLGAQIVVGRLLVLKDEGAGDEVAQLAEVSGPVVFLGRRKNALGELKGLSKFRRLRA